MSPSPDPHPSLVHFDIFAFRPISLSPRPASNAAFIFHHTSPPRHTIILMGRGVGNKTHAYGRQADNGIDESTDNPTRPRPIIRYKQVIQPFSMPDDLKTK